MRYVLILILLCSSAHIFAGNPLFRDGDAFFAVSLNAVLIERLKAHKGGAFTFYYQRPYGASEMKCGYYGTRRLELESLSVAVAQSLIETYDNIRISEKTQMVEVAGMLVEAAQPKTEPYVCIYLSTGLRYSKISHRFDV